MTVTKGRRQAYVYPDSNNASDTETLHLPSTSNSDVESERNFVVNRVATVVCLTDFCYIKKNAGRRKQRRFNNRTELQVLSEEEETEHGIKLMEDYKSPFARVLENESNLRRWNEFINLSEEEQRTLLEFVPEEIRSYVTNKHTPRISSRIKRAMKVKKNLSMDMVEKLENEVVNYFLCSPEGVFVSSPPTSFERLLLHAIAQYHCLKSISLINVKRSVEVTCDAVELWKPMQEPFCNFVRQLG
ncbi:hypothetical protein RN001_016185 [Aquatica leii]|uniref:R3H-associated N-terminal domain-containing protein n=1 Tax=Aquatica leii TaxID=1421715 RepID=A0AAN7P1E2_9COLE|nr:hypothetical protein RN001_016185 [Aquatica leii]